MYLRNFYKFAEVSFYDEIKNSLELVDSNKGQYVSGVYARLSDGSLLVCFRSIKGVMLLYKGMQFSIDKVIDLQKDENIYFLKYYGKNGVDVIKDSVTPLSKNINLSMEEEDDFNFLQYIYNLSRNKERQSRVFNQQV